MNRRELLFVGLPFFRRGGGLRLAGARFQVLRNGHAPVRYLHIHGNEPTAREVLTAHMRTHQGSAYLIAGDKRNVPAGPGVIDPNRMFSREGADKNLRLLNPGWTNGQLREVLDLLDRGRERLLRSLLPHDGGLLFAVHNNAEGYSMRAETAISDRVAWNNEPHPHEFFLCTGLRDFELLARSPYNVVLQKTAPIDDDGSLSRLAARRGVRYVNLECELGNVREQTEMLAFAFRLLARAPRKS